jgi:NAD(P)-dependent dehydrogenase (short-subunit alcohol dehydrogenase family)
MASVLITGASKGIGRAVAVEFAARGHRVVATARNPRTLDALDVDQRLALDVTDQQSVDAAVSAAGRIDILISNAGSIFNAAIEAIPTKELLRIYAENTVGALRVAQAVLPQMRERGSGRLLFMSSVVSGMVRPGGAAYASTKWALEALVEGLATEVRHFGIKATLLQPGAVSSGALDDVLTYRLEPDPYAPLLVQLSPFRVMLTPEEVAVATADVAEMEAPPLRVPIGESSEKLLAARKAAPVDVPFMPIPLDW